MYIYIILYLYRYGYLYRHGYLYLHLYIYRHIYIICICIHPVYKLLKGKHHGIDAVSSEAMSMSCQASGLQDAYPWSSNPLPGPCMVGAKGTPAKSKKVAGTSINDLGRRGRRGCCCWTCLFRPPRSTKWKYGGTWGDITTDWTISPTYISVHDVHVCNVMSCNVMWCDVT